MGQIIFISTYRELTVRAKEAAAEMNLDIAFFQGAMDDVSVIIDGIGEAHIDACVSRGGTADYVRQRYGCPVISMDTSIYDLLECVESAAKSNKRIAVTSYGKPFLGLDLMERLFGLAITNITFCSQQELERKLGALAMEGGFHVIGGGSSAVLAERYGMQSTVIGTSSATIKEALSRALEAAAIRRGEKQRAKRLKTILENIYDGVLAVDQAGRIEVCNPAAARMLGIDGEAALGHMVESVISGTQLMQVLRTGASQIKEFQNVGDTRIVTSRVPVRDREEVVGAVATFEEINKVVQVERRIRQEQVDKGRFEAKFTFDHIIGRSAAILEKKRLAVRYAASDLTVMLYGQSGTGKEMFAQGIHNAGCRRASPFVAVNCGALPQSLLESELFGYEEGAFTGAKRKGKAGLFELAHTGTIFLDEIDALPMEMQCRLLRVLQEREVLRIGGAGVIPVDIRVIAATNQPPEKLLAEKKLREDLYYRLNVLYLELPELKERAGDIPLLAAHFLAADHIVLPEYMREKIFARLCHYDWPGNVRELYNMVQRLAFLWPDWEADLPGLMRMLLPRRNGSAPEMQAPFLRDSVKIAEREKILNVLRAENGIGKAAQVLGIGRSTLWRKMKELGIDGAAD